MTSIVPPDKNCADGVEIAVLHNYLNDLLAIKTFQDYCPNGLQVAGRARVRTLVSGVSANLALIEAALEQGADALLVHHGFFWKGEDPCLTGIKKTRLQRLLGADLNLLAYHLPLDAHPRYGNNAQLAQRLGLRMTGMIADIDLLCQGETVAPLGAAEFSAQLAQALQRQPLHIPGQAPLLKKIAWCSGAAQDYVEAAARAGMDAYISGEISERTVHCAREYGIHYFAVGHHASERYGVQALAAHVAEQFGLAQVFIDIDNPI
jgi:dinuclear metal center YbgI/SA1388 family protein